MKSALTAALVSLAFATSAYAALQQGQPAPAFSAKASLAGKPFDYSLKDALAKGPVVVYFYPSAYTGGCNLQARNFAQRKAEFDAAGASIIGVSLDSIERLNAFSADPEYCAGKIAVASDADGSIAKSYELKVQDARAGMKDTRGAEIDHGFAERTTFIVAKDGTIAATIGDLSAADNVVQSLAAVKRIGAAGH